MNLTTARRLARLESTLQGPITSAMSELGRALMEELAIRVGIRETVGLLAERHSMHERGEPLFEPFGPGKKLLPGWYEHTSEDERCERIKAEVRRLIDGNAPTLREALAEWLALPEREGWPPHWLNDGTPDTFWRAVNGRRQEYDSYRDSDDPAAREWRVAHPGWRPDLDAEGYVLWEESELEARYGEALA